ncbi:hypothetical protein NIES267_74100 (plasmid) [Calothrix parasitica NIES-267]|uniref:Uncharacterized protein n=1 Tax=Calothrix parasitica NIES-267 TaxID=1973488 RepID=A0A1Z4M347_9CYAN|nr:hypothetical protein NIES267_74100 [Calothrix parasitica NIES-267]
MSYQSLKNELEEIANDFAKLKRIDEYEELVKLTQEQSDVSLADSLQGILSAIKILKKKLASK